MLKSLRVSNFRAFKNLQVKHLGRVNLIIGRNNVGKTTFLEAVHLYSSGDVLNPIMRLLRRRREYSLNKSERVLHFSNLFHQDVSNSLRIEIGEANDNKQLVIRSMWRWQGWSEDDKGIRRPNDLHDNPPEDEELVATKVLTVKRGTETIQFTPVESDSYPNRFLRKYEKDHQNSLFLPSSGFQDESVDIAELWDRVVLTDKEISVLDALRVIEPDLERMAMVQRKGHGFAMVKLPQQKNMPLHSLGEGMNKLFELALGLVNTGEGGTFLVDEIDSGLHFTTLVDVWRLIFRTAARLQVQVFATTHSWECIKAFQKAAFEHSNDGLLIQLERTEDDIRAELFWKENLTSITRESIEVR